MRFSRTTLYIYIYSGRRPPCRWRTFGGNYFCASDAFGPEEIIFITASARKLGSHRASGCNWLFCVTPSAYRDVCTLTQYVVDGHSPGTLRRTHTETFARAISRKVAHQPNPGWSRFWALTWCVDLRACEAHWKLSPSMCRGCILFSRYSMGQCTWSLGRHI